MSDRLQEQMRVREALLFELRSLFDRAHQLGNDSGESREIANFVQLVGEGKMSPEDAVAQAHALLDAKNEP